MAEEYGVKMKKPGEVTLESEFEKIKKVRTARYTSHERAPFSIEKNVMVWTFAPLSMSVTTAFEIDSFCGQICLPVAITLQKQL